MNKKLSAVFLALALLFSLSFGALAEDTTVPSSTTAPTTTTVPTTVPTTTAAPTTTVKAVALSACTVTLGKTEYTFSGEARTPAVTVSQGSRKFVLNKDYAVTYQNNINVGTAKVIVSAAKNSTTLSGSVTKTFKINKKTISSFKNKSLSTTDYVYSGKAKTPTLLFSNSTFKAKLGRDYTLKYKNNVKIGIATVTAKGIGNFKGTYSKSFYIHPAVVKGLKISQVKDKTFRLSWNKVSGNIDGYRIYRYNSSKKDYDYAVTTKNTYFDVSGRTPGTSYTYMVKAYKKVGSKYVMGDASAGKSVTTRPEQVVLKSSYYKGKYYTFKWEKVSASGYQIKYAKDSAFKKSKKVIEITSSKTTSKKIKLSSKTQYYYKVRAYKISNGKKIYGDWSEVKTTQFSNVYSSYSTTFNSPAGRTTNIKVACKYIDGKILKPGEVFSFNSTVGQRTAARGFKEATVYSGQSVEQGLGGGVCQVSTTIFNAALLANLPIVSRYQHTMKVHYVPAGRDAAISWPSVDLKFKNSLSENIKISAKVYNDSKIEIKLLTNSNSSPKKVSLKVSQSGNTYTLTRSVGKTVNYRTSSTY